MTGNGEGILQYSSQADFCLLHNGGFTLFLFIAEHQARGKLWILIFKVFDLARLEIESERTVSLADALSTRLLVRCEMILCSFQWTNNRWIFMIYKLLLLIYWTVFFITGLFTYEDVYTWWTKLTAWGVVTVLLYLMTSTFLVMYGLCVSQSNPKISDQKLATISSSVNQNDELERNNNVILTKTGPG